MAYLDRNGMPVPTYDRDKKRMGKVLSKRYKQMFDYLLLQLQFNPDDPKTIRQAEIMRQISYWLRELDKEMYREIEKTIRKAFKDGQAYHLLSVNEAKNWEEALDSASFNKIQRGKVEALIADTYNDILLSTNNTEEHVRKVVRNTVRKVAQYHSVQNTRYTEQIRDLKKELSKQGLSKTIQKDGFVGVVDRAGKRWKLDTYAKMVITTKVNDAFIEGAIHESTETGFDLAVISDHSAEDACRRWEGVVISLTGATEGYPTYKEARATNEIWHPNCTHYFSPIRSIDMLHKDEIKENSRKKRALGDYKNRVYKRKR